MVGTKAAFIEQETGTGPQEKPFEGTEKGLLSNFELYRSCCLSSGLAELEKGLSCVDHVFSWGCGASSDLVFRTAD